MKNNKTHQDIIESASVTSLMRYLLSNSSNKVKNPDFYGQYFVNGKWEKYLEKPEQSRKEMQEKLPGCLYYHLIRTLKFDESLEKWITHNPNSQVIILGAGFDSRFVRFKEILDQQNISIYEFDLEAMVQFKKDKIIENKIAPNNAFFQCACNFNENNLFEIFFKADIDSERNTLVLLEGVTYFLTESNIQDSLSDLKRYFQSKLQITLDYAYRDYIEGDLNFYGAKELYNVLCELDEPHYFGLNFEESESYFLTKGYKTLENLSAMMLESKYLRDSFGTSVGLPHVFNAMIDIVKIEQ